MPESDRNGTLYPNAGDGEGKRSGLSRRRLLSGTAAVGTVAAAGCAGSDGTAEDGDGDGDDMRPTVFVFNTCEGTVSVVDAGRAFGTTYCLGNCACWHEL